MRKYILISVILVCAYGCGKKDSKEKIKNLENVNNNLGLKLEELNTEREVSSAFIKEVNALMKDIQATENQIEERKNKLYSAKEVEDTVDRKEEILNGIQKLYDGLNRHRKKTDELQSKLYSFRVSETQNYAEISSLKNYVTQLGKKQEELTNEIGHLKRELSVKDNEVSMKDSEILKKNNEISMKDSEILKKDNEISMKDNKILKKDNEILMKDNAILKKDSEILQKNSEISKKDNEILKKELEIKNLHQEINTIFFAIGNSKELRRKKIIDIKRISPFIKKFVLGPDVDLAEFEEGILTTHTKLRVVGKIKELLPYRNKDHYDISYENGVSFLNIKDTKNFWLQKYLVVITN